MHIQQCSILVNNSSKPDNTNYGLKRSMADPSEKHQSAFNRNLHSLVPPIPELHKIPNQNMFATKSHVWMQNDRQHTPFRIFPNESSFPFISTVHHTTYQPPLSQITTVSIHSLTHAIPPYSSHFFVPSSLLHFFAPFQPLPDNAPSTRSPQYFFTVPRGMPPSSQDICHRRCQIPLQISVLNNLPSVVRHLVKSSRYRRHIRISF